MHYKVEIDFDMDYILPIDETDSHAKQVLDTRIQMESAEMILNKIGLPGYNLLASINIEKN